MDGKSGEEKKKRQKRKEKKKKTLQAIGATQWVMGCGRRLAKLFGGEKPLRRRQRGWLVGPVIRYQGTKTSPKRL